MRTHSDCISCFLRQATEAIELACDDPALRQRVLHRVRGDLEGADRGVIPVAIAQRLQRAIREETGHPDPYRDLKGRMNTLALDLLPALTETVRRHPNPREAAVRLTIAGNLLDAGSKTRVTLEELPRRLDAVWDAPLIGSVEELFLAAEKSRRILYLADNAGEIVFDRLLIAALPTDRITLAVRGAPVINDATLEDAQAAGVGKMVPVMANGSDAPGTRLEECSDAFRACFQAADLVIAKGQGNYETLCRVDKRMFFLLTVKCRPIAEHVGAAVGALVVRRHEPATDGAPA